ncbi:hypothetical protein [Vibrio sp. SCSIO 43136]|uniref:hypothetical protein n=1 Tax=Vibrio sp. SCSIO 43136 TaxID=2819101 RepID=UPI0020762D4A|nr:hypothetical protein [Vibrio sp. SCSIO 43136]USD66020.1 hypothetical protein J4N39_04130 [Vibrio sp. SCSIO 43136]
MADKSQHSNDHETHNPIIGSPSNEDIVRAMGNAEFRKELDAQYGVDKVDEMIRNALKL